jgi:hypothetical protein
MSSGKNERLENNSIEFIEGQMLFVYEFNGDI